MTKPLARRSIREDRSGACPGVARRLLLLVVVVGAAWSAPAPVWAQSEMDRQFLALINETRIAHGLDPLRFDSRAQRWAEDWTPQIIRAGRPFHQELQPFVGGSIVRVGENVGVSTEGVEAVFQGFMASAGHRANILDPAFTHVGIGTLRGRYQRRDATWTTHLFLRIAR